MNTEIFLLPVKPLLNFVRQTLPSFQRIDWMCLKFALKRAAPTTEAAPSDISGKVPRDPLTEPGPKSSCSRTASLATQHW